MAMIHPMQNVAAEIAIALKMLHPIDVFMMRPFYTLPLANVAAS